MDNSTNIQKEKFRFFSFFFTHLVQTCNETGIKNWVELEPNTDYEQVKDVAVSSTLEQIYKGNISQDYIN